MRLRLDLLVGALLGLALGVLVIATMGQKHTARSNPAVNNGRALLPEADGALGHVLLHWTPDFDGELAQAYADFLRALAPDVRVTFVLAQDLSQAERASFEQRLLAIDPTRGLLQRVERVEVVGPITAWSKDRALVSVQESSTGRALLFVPAEPSRDWKQRYNDWRSVSQVAQHFADAFQAEVAPFDFDAGDLTVARGALIIDANLLEKNRRRGYERIEQLAARLGEYLRMQVIALGRHAGDTPRHHLSMYMTPLTGNRVLVGDPRAAAAIVGNHFEVTEPDITTSQPLVADFSADTIGRFELAKRDLMAHGFEITSIVNVPFDDKTYLSYTNGIFEVRNGRHIAYVPSYDIPALDEAAHDTYRKLGWDVIPIHVRRLFPYHGTIGCVVNVLQRR